MKEKKWAALESGKNPMGIPYIEKMLTKDMSKLCFGLVLMCCQFFHSTGVAFPNENVRESFDVPTVLKQVVALVEPMKDSREKFYLLGEMGIVQVKAGYIGDAMQSLASFPDGFHKNYQKNALRKEIALAQAKVGKTQSALEMAQTITSLERESTLGGIALAKAESGDVAGALALVQRIKRGTRAEEEAFKAIGKLQAKRGDLRGGIQIALQAGDYSTHPFWGIVFEQVKAGQLKDLLTELRRIPSDIHRQYGLWAVVVALIGIKDMDSAIEVAKLIPEGYSSAHSWKDIALAQMEAGNQKASFASIQRALAGALKTINYIAKSDILWRIAGVQAKSGDIVGALQTAEFNEAEFHRNSALRDIVVEQSKAGDLKGSLRTASRIREKFGFSYPYIFVLQNLAKAGKVNQAIKIAISVESELGEDSPFEAIAFGQAESGDIEGALKTLAKIEQKEGKASYEHEKRLGRISYIQSQDGDLEGAVRTAFLIGESRRARALKDISLALVKKGRVDRALEIISSIKEERSLADLLQTIARAQAYQGDPAGVLKWSQKITSPFVKSKVLLGALRGVHDTEKS